MEEVQQPCPARKEEVPETPVIYIVLRFRSSFADCCILLWSNVETTLHEKQVAVLVKTEPAKQASVIEEDISSEQKIETPLPNISKARIEKEGVVLSATEANYTRASVERVCRNIVSIPRGQVYKIVLSDGTEVWMNASSRLSFPTRFSGSRRAVTLEGEAYFKVARDEQHPL